AGPEETFCHPTGHREWSGHNLFDEFHYEF
ncbi:unnamed protein product, partial [marine sediment metagenome]